MLNRFIYLLVTCAEALEWTESRKILEEALHQSNLHELDKSYILSEEIRLTSRLTSLGLDIKVMQGDGNCQFRSISYALFGTARHHAYVRRKCVKYMLENTSRFKVFLGEQFDEYIHKIRIVGVWGDELTLRAACEAFSIMINLITSETTNWFIRYVPEREVVHEIFIAYIAPVHYNSIERRKKRAFVGNSAAKQKSRILKSMNM